MKVAPAVSLCLLVAASAHADELARSVEEIYVVRSLRLSRDAASPFCSADRTGFAGARSEDHYKFQSIAVDSERCMAPAVRPRCDEGVTPNPSIERTFQRPLRALWPAALVKRYPSREAECRSDR